MAQGWRVSNIQEVSKKEDQLTLVFPLTQVPILFEFPIMVQSNAQGLPLGVCILAHFLLLMRTYYDSYYHHILNM